MQRSTNPFRFTGPLRPDEMIGRDGEAATLLSHAHGGHLSRLEAPRRYGKTSLLGRVAAEAAADGMATALVDLEDVLSLGALVARIERGYSNALGGPLRRWVDRQLASWELGLSLGAVGFGVTLKSSPNLDPEPVLLRLLSLPEQIHRKHGVRTLVVFDEVQGLLRVDGAAGIVRSVIQHHADVASYVFAGSAPSLMRKLFDRPDGPFLAQGIPISLDPLEAHELGEAVEHRFRETGRDPADGLGELVRFSRGHPQRSMQLAHYLWQRTPRGASAGLEEWLAARDDALSASERVLRAHMQALPLNEQRAAQALALAPASPTSQETLKLVGLPRNSAYAAVDSLADRGESIETEAGQRLTDPLLEYWLRERREL